MMPIKQIRNTFPELNSIKQNKALLNYSTYFALNCYFYGNNNSNNAVKAQLKTRFYAIILFVKCRK